MTAHNWRLLRERATHDGIGALMGVPSMHIVLDRMEQLGLESATHGAKTESELRLAISEYHSSLYRPDPVELAAAGPDAPPPGWDDEDDGFDAFLASGLN